MIRVSFQGERGAYSESAATSFFSDNIETLPCKTFADALKKTSDDLTEFTILPVENSLEGSVGESYDLLNMTELKATGESHVSHHQSSCPIFNPPASHADCG